MLTRSLQRQNPETILQRYWGYPKFRANQADIITALVTRRDALVVMPTGGGKSICFQVPALLHPGLTIVISPLVALMEDQVQALQSRGIPAATLHYQMAKSDRRDTLWKLEQQRLKLLYISPETLLSQPVWQRLCQNDLRISSLVVDEAHCLSQWGDSFRPTYLRLGAVRSALLQHKPPGTKINLAAFTATGDLDVQRSICQGLQLQNPQVFTSSPYRPNLRLSVQYVFTPHQRQTKLKRFIQEQNGTSGIVYVRTRNESERLAAWLQTEGFAVAAYHAGLMTQARRTIEQQWLNDKLQFVICTNAFGLGVDKSDVRWICHFHAPLELSEYLQEIGRAGRDGKVANTLLLASEPTGLLDSSDRKRWRYFEQQAQKQQKQAIKLLVQLPKCGDVTEISRQFPKTDLALAILQQQGNLVWYNPFEFEIHSTQIKQDKAGRSMPNMPNYLRAKGCRWRFLLAAFGVEDLAASWFCGKCDRCQKHGDS
ncbi:ATP-dependent DNA helicase RecQ [filamentous cyanobacterium LEGE 11480]|uniref:DNA 3'-5' helicase n=2 Tax=Romeriopsis TaxID=2992131 RepID=A0A928VP21_9CYAN|nr:ATP-dependent DNA helicase RecQ [Romeriopsis navalis LEGE 11480]